MEQTYYRAATIWHSRCNKHIPKELPIVWISGSEGTGTRLVKYGEDVWGSHKWNRLPIEDAPPRAQELAICTNEYPCDYH